MRVVIKLVRDGPGFCFERFKDKEIIILESLQLMISSNVAVKAHLAEVVRDKIVNKKIKDKCVWQFWSIWTSSSL